MPILVNARNTCRRIVYVRFGMVNITNKKPDVT